MKIKTLLIGLLVQLVWDALFWYVLLEPSIQMFGLPDTKPIRSVLLQQMISLLFAPFAETYMTAKWFYIFLMFATKLNKDLEYNLSLKVAIALFIGIAWGMVHPGAVKVSAIGGFVLLMLGFVYHIKDEPFSRQKNINGMIYMGILHFIHNLIF